MPEAQAGSAIRVSMGPETTKDDVDAFLEAWTTLAARAKQTTA
jgi:cysteine sulfinate desulfinase/cysteine desulfurase-like protein